MIAKQLKDAGFNIDLQIYDWATLLTRRSQPPLWDLFFTTHGFVPDPMLWTFMSPTYPGWWDTEKKRQYSSEFTANTDPAKRMVALENIQKIFYDEVPLARTGDIFTYDIYSPKVQGVGSETLLNFNKFWNVWFKK